MKAVVLVGGFGTRLRPLTLTRPKQMLPVGQRTMLEVVIAHLGRHGVTEAVLALGYKPDVFREAYPDGVCAGVQLHYVVESEPLDTAGAIAYAAREAGIDETFVALNGDVLSDLDVSALVRFHHANGGTATIHLTPVEDPSAFGVVTYDEDGRVLGFIEKPARHEAPSNLVNAGTYVLEPSVLDLVPAGEPTSIERVVFPALVEHGQLYAMATDGYWVDAGKPEPYLQVNLDALHGGRGPFLEAEPARAPGAVVAPSAQVSDSVLGRDAAVAGDATVHRSVLFPYVIVEAGASVEGSLLGEGARVGEGAKLSDCVIGDGAVVAPGEVLTGVRRPG